MSDNDDLILLRPMPLYAPSDRPVWVWSDPNPWPRFRLFRWLPR